jgi:hypothetical protein
VDQEPGEPVQLPVRDAAEELLVPGADPGAAAAKPVAGSGTRAAAAGTAVSGCGRLRPGRCRAGGHDCRQLLSASRQQ